MRGRKSDGAVVERIAHISCIKDSAPDDIFITCESFEDRCIGSVLRLKHYQTRMSIIFQFLSRTKGVGGERKREDNRKFLVDSMTKSSIDAKPELLHVDPYNPLDLLLRFDECLESRGIRLRNAKITVDISCFTKIQLLFLIKYLRSKISDGYLRLLYSSPSYYCSLDLRKNLAIGFHQLRIVPFDDGSDLGLGEQELAMVILLGHEGSRILHAWSELEPSETHLILSSRRGDPELTSITERQNEMLLRRAREGAPGFMLHSASSMQIEDAILLYNSILEDESERAGSVRLAFVPMGPKPLVAAFALSAAETSGLPVDIVYPIPLAYSADYSAGIDSTFSYIWTRKNSAHFELKGLSNQSSIALSC
jgi:hypothetical protein